MHSIYKIILNLKKTTANIILYGELGRYSIDTCISVKARMIGFWQKILMINRIKLPLIFFIKLYYKCTKRICYTLKLLRTA